MNTRAIALVGAMALIGLGACGGDDDSDEQTTTSATTTSVPASTSTSSSSTTSTSTTTSSTSTSSTSTTTSTSSTVPATVGPTAPPVAEPLRLRPDGLGDAVFGADAEGVIAFVATFLGPPTTDSVVDPLQFTCPGTTLRLVTWGDLTLYFSDSSSVASGYLHFFSYVYGPSFGTQIAPFGMRTDAGVVIGSTVADLRRAYPDVIIDPGEPGFVGPNFSIIDGLTGFLTDAADIGQVTEILGGFGCGE
jgi:hypothetical protein